MKKVLTVIMLLALFSGALAEGTADYVGGMFVGPDPWEGQFSVIIENIEDGRMTWTLSEAGEEITFTESINDTQLTDGTGTFHIIGISPDDESIHYDYTGDVALVDGAVTLTLTEGQATQLNANGGSGFHMAEALEEANRTVTLLRVED